MTDRTPKVVGVDACPFGWFVTVLEDDSVRTEAYESFGEAYQTYSEAGRILVDIPIGLPTDSRRRCDEQARELLGCRGLSVFYPPCPSAARCDDYEKANEEHRDRVGHGLSQQAYSIREKILEVDAVVDDRYDGLVRESHPELCFAALNDQPIAYPKASEIGRELRLALLNRELDDAESCYHDARERYLLKEVRRDDILDSMVLAVAAREDNLTMVPSSPHKKEPRIHYPEFDFPGPVAV